MRTDYEQLAERYDEDRARFGVPRDQLIDELLALQEPLRVLDLGCGTGTWLAAQRGFFGDGSVRWIGADPSAAMLARASGKGLAALVRAAAEDLPLSDATVDYIACNYVFHHLDKNRALDEIARTLTPGGVFRMSNIEPSAGDGWLYEFFPETLAIDAVRFWPPARIVEALEARSFTVSVHLDAGTEPIPAGHALADAERRVSSQLSVLDDDAYERGLVRLRAVADEPGATVSESRARIDLTARRAAS